MKILSQEQARHWAKVVGKSQGEIEKILENQKELVMVAERALFPLEF